MQVRNLKKLTEALVEERKQLVAKFNECFFLNLPEDANLDTLEQTLNDFYGSFPTGSYSLNITARIGTVIKYLPDVVYLTESNGVAYAPYLKCMWNVERLPYMDLSKCTDVSNMFNGLSKVTELPAYDFSGATNAEGLFNGLSVNHRHYDFSKVTKAREMYRYWPFTNAPDAVFGSITDAYAMFNSAKKLDPTQLDMSWFESVTNAQSMFYNAGIGKDWGVIDLPNATTIYELFGSSDSGPNSVAGINAPKATNAGAIFNTNSSVHSCAKYVGDIYVPLATTMSEIFDAPSGGGAQYGLYELGVITCNSVTAANNIFAVYNNQSYYYWTKFGGLRNLGMGYDAAKGSNYSSYTFNLRAGGKLDYESLINVANELYDLTANDKPSQQIILQATSVEKLTESDIALFTNKGWTVTT